MYDQEIYWDDDLICPANGVSPRLASNKTLEEVEINVFPNPASNVLNLKYSINDDTNAEFILYNMYGYELLRRKLDSRMQLAILDISELSSNLYIYKIIVEGSIFKEDKISILR